MRSRALTVRNLHRWLGITALVFVCLLSATGIALNHSGELRLAERYLAAPWLLAWYGMESPEPTAAFATDLGHVVLAGERLFLDDLELAGGIPDAVGAAVWRGDLVVAGAEGLFFFSADGGLEQHVPPPENAPIDRLGLTGRAAPSGEPWLIAANGTARFRYDGGRWHAHDEQAGNADSVQWSLPVPVDDAVRERVARAYRGPGVSLERVLADLHSGRLFAQAGKVGTDVVGVALLALGVTGLALWLRRR